jgi:serine phosphatase RsbU (regulator of sigma subunit)
MAIWLSTNLPRRFLWKLLVLNGGAFVALLAIVATIAWVNYDGAQREAIEQAGQQQLLVARQTASGLQNYMQSIVETVQLGQRMVVEMENWDEPDNGPPGGLQGGPPGGGRRPNGANGPGGRLEGIRDRVVPQSRRLMIDRFVDRTWQQLGTRVSHLIAADLKTAVVATSRHAEGVPPADKIVAAATATLLKHEGEAPVTQVTSRLDVDGFGFVVICLRPTRDDARAMLAVVPMKAIEKMLVEAGDGGTGAPRIASNLSDSTGQLMHASDARRIGTNIVDASPDPAYKQLAERYRTGRTSGFEVIDVPIVPPPAAESPTTEPRLPVGSGRTVMAIQPVKLPDGSTWAVSVGSDLRSVKSIVDQLFSGALLWVPLVVVTAGALLVSTVWSLTRAQRELERDRAAVMEKELDHARRIQMNWLPKQQPTAPIGARAVEVHAINQPASHVSGDFYNWFTLPDGRTAVVIGDVTGHGLAGAFLMSTTQMLVRSFLQKTLDPAETLRQVNRELSQQSPDGGQFVTLLLLVIDPTTGTCIGTSAGHPPPLVWDGARVRMLELPTDLVLGVLEEEEYKARPIELPTPCSLLLYTDGAFECRNTTGERYSIERLAADITTGDECGPEAFVAATLKAVDQFRSGAPLDDDLTIVALRVS